MLRIASMNWKKNMNQLNLVSKMKTIKCPKCENTDKLTTTDNEGLCNSRSLESAKKNDFFLDNEIYASITCWNCGWSGKIQGDIKWKLIN